MNSNIKRLNRFIANNDHLLNEGLHVVDNRSFFKKIFKSFINYAGSIRRVKSKELINGKMVDIECLLVNYFVKNKVHYYAIKMENGIIRESDDAINEDLAGSVLHLDEFLSKNNVYGKFAYSAYVKKLLKELRK